VAGATFALAAADAETTGATAEAATAVEAAGATAEGAASTAASTTGFTSTTTADAEGAASGAAGTGAVVESQPEMRAAKKSTLIIDFMFLFSYAKTFDFWRVSLIYHTFFECIVPYGLEYRTE